MGSENVWMSGAKESSVTSEALGEKKILLERLWDKVWTKNISQGEDREQKKKKWSFSRKERHLDSVIEDGFLEENLILINNGRGKSV